MRKLEPHTRARLNNHSASRKQNQIAPKLEPLEPRALLAAIVELQQIPLDAAVTATYNNNFDASPQLSGELAVNNNRQVIGEQLLSTSASQPDSIQVSILAANTQPTALGSLTGFDESFGMAINDAGDLAGYVSNDPDGGIADAVVYKNGAFTNLGSLGGALSIATGINNSGDIVGYSATIYPGQFEAFLYSNGKMTSLGTFATSQNAIAAFSAASAINNNGQIVGYATTGVPFGGRYAFLYSNGTMTNLGSYTLSGSNQIGVSDATDINDSGEIVGFSETSTAVYQAFLYKSGTMTDIGTLGGSTSIATSINDAGQIVGYSQDAETNSTGANLAFLYTNGVMTNLNTLLPENSGWNLQMATSINNNGEIVGEGIAPTVTTTNFCSPSLATSPPPPRPPPHQPQHPPQSHPPRQPQPQGPARAHPQRQLQS